MRTNGKHTGNSVDRASSEATSKVVPFLIGAGIGAIAGAAVALLFAPAEGAALRREAKGKFDDVTEGINSILKNAKLSAEKMLREGRGNAEEIIDRTRERADDILDEADRAIHEAKKRSADLGFSREEQQSDEDDHS
jgi:gas vesicle protein